MAYSTSNPPSLRSPSVSGGGIQIWDYASTDPATDVDAPGYFSNFGELGGRVGDQIIVTDTDASPRVVTSHLVLTVSAVYPGAATITQGVAISGAAGV